jgi:hypothetical protein
MCRFILVPKYSRFLIALTDRVLDARAVDLEKSENIKKQVIAH